MISRKTLLSVITKRKLKRYFRALAVAAVIILGGIGMAALTRPQSPTANDSKLVPSGSPAPTVQTVVSAEFARQSTIQRLNFLIEEEKLAHDVYTKMNEIWGSQVFGNILQSESTHQSQVLALLTSRSLSDPRTGTLGTFRDQDLQKLYDSLIAKGKTSAKDAYEVGVAIEEKDIADISNILSNTTDESDVVATLERLRSGSENHLRAFNRQLSRVR